MIMFSCWRETFTLETCVKYDILHTWQPGTVTHTVTYTVTLYGVLFLPLLSSSVLFFRPSFLFFPPSFLFFLAAYAGLQDGAGRS